MGQMPSHRGQFRCSLMAEKGYIGKTKHLVNTREI